MNLGNGCDEDDKIFVVFFVYLVVNVLMFSWVFWEFCCGFCEVVRFLFVLMSLVWIFDIFWVLCGIFFFFLEIWLWIRLVSFVFRFVDLIWSWIVILFEIIMCRDYVGVCVLLEFVMGDSFCFCVWNKLVFIWELWSCYLFIVLRFFNFVVEGL